jgi:hypothetical protein
MKITSAHMTPSVARNRMAENGGKAAVGPVEKHAVGMEQKRPENSGRYDEKDDNKFRRRQNKRLYERSEDRSQAIVKFVVENQFRQEQAVNALGFIARLGRLADIGLR